ncbi:DeoR/GlpR family DNA-binding transcription regulator [Silvimonas sp.]|uniref:DeoR/GlpR family DNA-binding transcription regulator n=1 Tax=Silvimonas sp. TaxID=2650811 RepID=UPI00283B5A7B|nr:DeoR/GlpR family DNA-binding transcription regulator [Silvimonas sp.]MDR3426613.1 DeoR/GlpR family DNA-binding transcription regulator [Silvimonas sp.]
MGNTLRRERFKSGTALPIDRHQLIRERLQRDGRVLASELAVEFGLSEDSVRRDLREMAAAGECQRVYGGAIAMSSNGRPIGERSREHVDRKVRLAQSAVRLAQSAVRLIQGGQLVFLDASTTNLAVAQVLPEDIGLTIATNSPAIAAALVGREDLRVILIGGTLDHHVGGTLGTAALLDIQQMRPDICFLGICSIDALAGVGASQAEDAAFKRQLVAISGAIVAVVTNEKLGTGAPFTIAPLAEITHLVVEADAEPTHLQHLAEAGTSLTDAGINILRAD